MSVQRAGVHERIVRKREPGVYACARRLTPLLLRCFEVARLLFMLICHRNAAAAARPPPPPPSPLLLSPRPSLQLNPLLCLLLLLTTTMVPRPLLLPFQWCGVYISAALKVACEIMQMRPWKRSLPTHQSRSDDSG